MKKYLNIFFVLILNISSFRAYAGEDKYDTVSKGLVAAQESAKVPSSRTADQISQAVHDSLIYLDELARSGKTDNATLDKAENVAKLLGETFFMIMRHQGIDVKDVEAKMTSVDKAVGVMREMLYDASKIMSFKKDATGRRTWGVSEARAREKVSQDTISQLSNFVDSTVTDMDNKSIMREDFLLKFNYLVDRGMQMKSQRAGQQNIAKWAYLGLAALTFVHPPLDLVLERTYYSTFYSSVIYLGSFMSLFVIKTRMTGAQTIELLQKVAMEIKDPSKARARLMSGGGGNMCSAIML